MRILAEKVREVPNRRARTKLVLDHLDKLQLKLPFALPYDGTIIASGLVMQGVKVMDSARVPIMFEFKNADPLGGTHRLLFKSKDDLRQDALTLQMMNLMNKIWAQERIDLHVIPYQCLATGVDTGIIQVSAILIL